MRPILNKANVCLMAHDGNEVNPSDDSDKELDEILDAYEEFFLEFKKLSSKNLSLKKAYSLLLVENDFF